MTARLSPEVLSLLGAELGSFEKLEIAAHLHRVGRPTPRAELQIALQLEPHAIHAEITELVGSGVLEVGGPPGYEARLGPRARAEDFSALMALYAEDRLSVVAALASSAVSRIRTMAARTFAEALVLKKKHRGDDEG